MKIQEIALRKQFEKRMRQENSWSPDKEQLLNKKEDGKFTLEIMEASFLGYAMCFDDLLKRFPLIRKDTLETLMEVS